MSTQRETIDFILEKLYPVGEFSARAMFGEYALYAKGKVVALVCDDQLHVKIMPESSMLESVCEKADPYPGARPHYLVEESQISHIEGLSEMLLNMSGALPVKKPKKKNNKKTRQ